jgi:hypothetical protein
MGSMGNGQCVLDSAGNMRLGVVQQEVTLGHFLLMALGSTVMLCFDGGVRVA